jgi:hypothetical protein
VQIDGDSKKLEQSKGAFSRWHLQSLPHQNRPDKFFAGNDLAPFPFRHFALTVPPLFLARVPLTWQHDVPDFAGG